VRNPNDLENITAVIVTYNIQNAFIKNIESLYNQVGQIIIVDNNSNDDSLSILTGIIQEHSDIILINNKENLGLSKAQNIGIRKSFERDSCKWILLLDDDSSLAENMTSNMLKSYENNIDKDKIGLITPRIKDIKNGRDYPCLMKKNNFIFKRYFLKENEESKNGLFCALASGSLIKRDVLEEIGLMNEAYFIDFIDWDFAIRLQKSNRIIICAGNAILYHQLGNKTSHHLLGKEFITTNQPPNRRFTSSKNRILFIRNNLFNSPAILLYLCMTMGYEIMLVILFEENKFSKLIESCKGMFAGVFTINTDIIPKL